MVEFWIVGLYMYVFLLKMSCGFLMDRGRR